MTAQRRTTNMPITAAVYPRGKGDNAPPEERLAEHRVSRLVKPVGFGVERQLRAKGLGALVDGLEREQPQQRKRRPRRRAQKPVTA